MASIQSASQLAWNHAQTMVFADGCSGLTRWTSGDHFIEWDWSEAAPGVVAMTNPLGVRTNLSVGGSPMGAAELGRLIFALEWQVVVMESVASLQLHPQAQ